MIGIGKKFSIFKRDEFTCQYCGKSGPGAGLECDHVVARANGGSDHPDNLITACWECNRGKRDRSIDMSLPLAARAAAHQKIIAAAATENRPSPCDDELTIEWIIEKYGFVHAMAWQDGDPSHDTSYYEGPVIYNGSDSVVLYHRTFNDEPFVFAKTNNAATNWDECSIVESARLPPVKTRADVATLISILCDFTPYYQ